jgi:hypothetical protein
MGDPRVRGRLRDHLQLGAAGAGSWPAASGDAILVDSLAAAFACTGSSKAWTT